jgi:hypothetical protein
MSVRTRRLGRLLQPGVPPGGGFAPCAAGFCYKTPIVNPFSPIFDFDSQSDTPVTLILFFRGEVYSMQELTACESWRATVSRSAAGTIMRSAPPRSAPSAAPRAGPPPKKLKRVYKKNRDSSRRTGSCYKPKPIPPSKLRLQTPPCFS